jgi:glycosyltransferase involved in cell wall biosynthesis
VAYFESLRNLVAGHRLEHRVRWLGERSDVSAVLADADVFCQPNVSPEPLGIVFLEAMAQGLPVVSSDCGGAQEIVPSSAGVLIPPGDAMALANALERLIVTPAARRELQAAGPYHALELADPVSRLADLNSLLTQVAAVGHH